MSNEFCKCICEPYPLCYGDLLNYWPAPSKKKGTRRVLIILLLVYVCTVLVVYSKWLSSTNPSAVSMSSAQYITLKY